MSALNLENRTMYNRDNLDVLRNINSRSIDLIYLDPPFNTKKRWHAPTGSTAAGASFSDIFRAEDVKDEWLYVIRFENEPLYNFLNHTKHDGIDYNYAYLSYMAIRLIECHRILKDTGSIYLHCDPIMSHYLKVVMDCIFGEDNNRNEIIWRMGWVSGFKTQKRGWIRNHDVILYYVKSRKARDAFNKEYIPYSPDYVRRDGKRPTGKGFPIEDTWNCHPGDILDSIMIKSFSAEKTGYPTQKPLALLERIIKASSNEEGVVLDPFCGCATTCVAAERLNRQWIGIDISVKAYELVQERIKKEVDNLFDCNKLLHYTTELPVLSDNISEEQKGYVYIISNPIHKEYKVGIAKNVERRLSNYQTGDPKRGFVIRYRALTSAYKEIEAAVFERFEGDREHEWVNAPYADITDVIGRLLTEKGGEVIEDLGE